MADEYKDQGVTFASGNSKWEPGTAPVLTGYKINGTDLANIYEQVASGSADGNTTNFITNNSTYSGQDLDAIFAAFGTTVSGDVNYDGGVVSPTSADLVGPTFESRSDVAIFADGTVRISTRTNSILRPSTGNFTTTGNWIDGFPSGNPDRNSPQDFEFRFSGGTGNTLVPDTDTGTNLPSFNSWQDIPATGWSGFHLYAVGASNTYIDELRTNILVEIRQKTDIANIDSFNCSIQAIAGGGTPS